MTYSEETLKKVKSFGALQYGIEIILSILNPEDVEQFVADFKDENSTLFTMWKSGFNSGKYNLDAQQFEIAKATADKTRAEAETVKLKLDGLRKYADLKHEYFGL